MRNPEPILSDSEKLLYIAEMGPASIFLDCNIRRLFSINVTKEEERNKKEARVLLSAFSDWLFRKQLGLPHGAGAYQKGY